MREEDDLSDQDPWYQCRRSSIIARIYKRTETVCGPLPSPCILWTGPTSGKGRGGGYPRMSLDGGTVAVHRVVFVNFHGYIPPKKQIDHRCKNRLCLNHLHLEMVSAKLNCARRSTPLDQLYSDFE